jgi:ankyrin repeat protein
MAAGNGNAAMVAALLKAGADANTARPEGQTVLMTAARAGRDDAVRILLDHGADVNAREGWFGETALMLAAADNHPAVVQALIGRGADVNVRTVIMDGEAPRGSGAAQPQNTTFPRGGFSALMFAARQGALESARALAAAGADVNLRNPDGVSTLVLALINGHFDVAGLLIDKGADVKATEPGGRTPLWAAVDIHTLEYTLNRPPPAWNDTLDAVDVVKRLLDRGADPNAALRQPLRPRKVNTTNPGLLGAGATPLMRAATHADMPVIRLLLDKGADSNAVTEIHTTPLMLAAGLGWRDLYSGGSERDAIDFITMCLERGADINAANDQGNTALHGAAQRGSAALVQFLADRGARLDAKNRQGLTPLDEALRFAPSRERAAAVLRDLMVKQGIPIYLARTSAVEPE